MNVFISGGCKNGKSMYAQKLALAMALAERPDMAKPELIGPPEDDEGSGRISGLKRPLYYIATMIPKDEEDRARIKKHLEAREGWGFETVEVGTGILDILGESLPTRPYLSDSSGDDEPGSTCTGSLADPKGVFLLDSVTALLSNEMFRADGSYDPDAGERLAEELVEFAERTGNTVFVSDYIYSDARRYDDMTENYRRALALCDRKLAEVCHRCVEVSYSTINDFK